MIGQLLPFLAAEHQQQVAQAVERAKQVTMPELNAIIGVSNQQLHSNNIYKHTHTHTHSVRHHQIISKADFNVMVFYYLKKGST